MKKVIGIGLLLALIAVIGGCGRTIRKEELAAGTKGEKRETSQFVPVRFQASRISVKVNADPKQVEQYLMDTRYLALWSVLENPKVVGKERFERTGDSVWIKGNMLGVPIKFKMTLVHYQPEQELYYFYYLGKTKMGTMRLNLQAMQDGTKIVKKAENEVASPSWGEIMDLVKYNQRVVKSSERGLAELQVRFDPGLSVQGLLSQGIRAEFNDAFYQRYSFQVWIKAAPEKVMADLTDLNNWQKREEKDHWNLGACLAGKESGPYPVRIRLGDQSYQADCFRMNDQSAQFISTYWVFQTTDQFARLQIQLKPIRSGTQLQLDYLQEVPKLISPETISLIQNLELIPRNLEKILNDVKNELEDAGQ